MMDNNGLYGRDAHSMFVIFYTTFVDSRRVEVNRTPHEVEAERYIEEKNTEEKFKEPHLRREYDYINLLGI